MIFSRKCAVTPFRICVRSKKIMRLISVRYARLISVHIACSQTCKHFEINEAKNACQIILRASRVDSGCNLGEFPCKQERNMV